MRRTINACSSSSLLFACLACSAQPPQTDLSRRPPSEPEAWLSQVATQLGRSSLRPVRSVSAGFEVESKTSGVAVAFSADSTGADLRLGRDSVRMTRLAATPAAFENQSATLVQRHAAPGVTASFFAIESGVEELIHVASPHNEVGYCFEHPRGIQLRAGAGRSPVLELSDAHGRLLGRASFPKVFDSDNVTWPLELAIDGQCVRLKVSAEASYPLLIDPVWSRPDLMSAARFRHTATLLQDGKVLIIGGADAERPVGDSEAGINPMVGIGTSVVGQAELYDPARGVFEVAGALEEARWGHTATLLRDGRVLVLGGFDADGHALSSAEVYGLADQTFTSFGDLHYARGIHTATLLADGRVLVVGGIPDPESSGLGPNPMAVVEAEIIDPDAGTFVDLGPVPGARPSHAAQLRPDGSVLIAWPATGLEPLLRFAQFDPTHDEFSEGPAGVDTGPWWFDVLLSDGERFPFPEVLVHSGTGGVAKLPDSGWVSVVRYGYNALSSGIGSPAALVGSAGSEYLVGGLFDIGAQSTQWVATSDYDATVFSYGSEMSSPRAWPTATALTDGSVLVAGGRLLAPVASAELMRPNVSVTPIELLEAVTSSGHAETVLMNGRVLFTGGWRNPTGSNTASLESPEEPRFKPMGALLSKRALHQGLLLPSGNVLIAGGKTEPVNAREEELDVKTGESRELDFRLRARGSGIVASNTAALFAGETGVEVLSLIDYRERGVDLPTPPGCPAPRLARLGNRHVAVLGRDKLFEIDVRTATLLKTTEVTAPRCNAVLTLVPDGTLLIAGGQDAAGVATTAAELYNPDDGGITAVDPLPEPSAGLIASSLYGGTLLLKATEPRYLVLFEASRGSFTPIGAPLNLLDNMSATRLVGGATFVTGTLPGTWPEGYTPPSSFIFGKPQPLPANWPEVPLEVTSDEEVELTGLELSETWPERSGGSTAGSATNTPIAVWVPLVGGLPAVGTFTKWSETKATWRVPHTPFHGLGTLYYARSGVQYPIRTVRISPLPNGAACDDATQCDSELCIDGVCCDGACDGTCQACTAALKGGGEDGVCGNAAVDSEETACKAETCGQTGLCDAKGACAVAQDGDICNAGVGVCSAGTCVRDLTGSSQNACDGDHTVTTSIPETATRAASVETENCEPYRCALSSGKCLDSCVTNADCVAGLLCDVEHRCVEPPQRTNTSVGCSPGCRVGAATGSRHELLSAVAALAMCLARRRRRAHQSS